MSGGSGPSPHPGSWSTRPASRSGTPDSRKCRTERAPSRRAGGVGRENGEARLVGLLACAGSVRKVVPADRRGHARRFLRSPSRSSSHMPCERSRPLAPLDETQVCPRAVAKLRSHRAAHEELSLRAAIRKRPARKRSAPSRSSCVWRSRSTGSYLATEKSGTSHGAAFR